MSSSYDDSGEDDYSDSFSDSLSELESLSFKGKPAGGRGTKKRTPGQVEPLMFRDEDPPRRWVGNLENIDTEEAAFELRQQVTDLTMVGSTTQFDALELVQDTEPVFAGLLTKVKREKEKKIAKSIRKYTMDSEIDITSVYFDPVAFLASVHKNTTHERLEQGILKLVSTSATRSHNIKRLVSLHFGQFVHCKDTIDLIQVLLKPELPPENTRLDLLAARPHNLPWLLSTLSPKQQEQMYQIITNKQRLQLGIQMQQQQTVTKTFTFGTGGQSQQQQTPSANKTPSSNQQQRTITPSSTPSGSAGSVNNDMTSPFAFAIGSQAVSDKSRIGRLQLVLATVAEKTDLIYSPLLTRRTESDHIRFALTIFRKYKLLLELPMRMRQHITNGRVDRFVHDAQKINIFRVSSNPTNSILQQALTECQQIRSHYASILLHRLADPRHNLYSQQRTMSYLFQLENRIEPTWYFLERQCIHIGNLLDRTYYDSSFNTSQASFISLSAKDAAFIQKKAEASGSAHTLKIGPDLLERLQNYNTNDYFNYNDGEYGDDDLDDDYNMFHNGPNAAPVGPAGSAFAQTVNRLGQTTPPTSFMEYQPRKLKRGQAPPQYDPNSINGGNSLPLFFRRSRHLAQAQAELISTNLLQIFTMHISPLLRLAYNVGNGSLFDVIKSSLSGSGADGEVDIAHITLNRHFISSQHLERLSTLIGQLTSKLTLYLSSLCIPGLDLREISGFQTSVMAAMQPGSIQAQQIADRRRLEALDLAIPSPNPTHSSNTHPSKSIAKRNSLNLGRGPTSSAALHLRSVDDDHLQSSPSTLGQLPQFTSRGVSASPLGILPHAFERRSGGFLPFQPRNSSDSGRFSPYTPSDPQQPGPFATFHGLNAPNAGRGNNPPFQSNQPKLASGAHAAHISSFTEDDVYHRFTRLHTVSLEKTRSVLPRHPNDPIQPTQVANFSHVVLHLLASLLLSLINNNLILLEPKILDPLLSFYVKLHSAAQEHLLLSASVSIATLKESFTLNPSSIYHHDQSTTLPIQFQAIIDRYLQSMVMLPSKQLLFRALLYFNAPPQFTLIANYAELVLTFADRLHSIAIAQNPSRLIPGTYDDSIGLDYKAQALVESTKSKEAVLTTTTEEVVTTKVITTKTIIGKDGKKEVITSEEILEDEAAPTIQVSTKTITSNEGDDFLARDAFTIDPGTGEVEAKPKNVTISRFGHELLSLAEQLNYNEHSAEPYSVGDVVAVNAQNIYNSTRAMESSLLNQLSPLTTSTLTTQQLAHITAAVSSGLNVEGMGASISSNPLLQVLGEGRVLLSVLSNCIHASQTIIPRAWRNLAELIQQAWPAKELLEMSFFLNQSGGSASLTAIDPQTRSQYTASIKDDLTKLKNKYNPSQRPGTHYQVSLSAKKKVAAPRKVRFHTGLTDSDDSESTCTEDQSYSDMSTDLESLLGDDHVDEILNTIGLSDSIWSSLTQRQQNYLNTAVVGGLGVAMSLALDNSYRKVQGVYLQLQTLLVNRYITQKCSVINNHLYDSLYRGGINWRKAPVPTHVREFLYIILQLMVETKSELVLFQNIDVSSVLTTIVENTMVTWCSLVKNVRVLSYNGAMQIALETNFLCRSMNRYTTPYVIKICQDVINLLHVYIEETIVTENVNTTFSSGAAMYTSEDGFDSQLFDAVSRLGMFSTMNKRNIGHSGKVDDNTGYEFSTSVSPLQSMLIQQRDQRNIANQRRGSSTFSSSQVSRGKGSERNEISLLQSALAGDEKRAKERAAAKPKPPPRVSATSIDDNDANGADNLLDDDDDDDDDAHEDDSFFDQQEEDDEASLVAGVISMRDLKSYTTHQVNKDLMIQFKIHTTHIDIDNILQQSLWSTRLSFATLRIDAEDPLLTLILDETSKGMMAGQDLFQRTYRTPEEVVDGYFKARYNANRLRENVRRERTQEEVNEQLVYQQWIKQNNLVYNSSLDSPELYVNLSIGQSKKYRELVSAQRSHGSMKEVQKVMTKYSTSSKTDSSHAGNRFTATTEVVEENDSEPEDFGVRVTRLVTKKKEVVEKTKAPKEKKEKPVKEKKQRKPTPIPEDEPAPIEEKESSSDLEDLFPTKKVEPVKVVEVKKVEEVVVVPPKPATPKAVPKPSVPAPLIIEPEPVKKIPTPPPTPKPTIIEERIIVTTTTTKQQQQLKIQQEEEEKRRMEKEMLILQQYQKKSTNLDFLDEGKQQQSIDDEFGDLDMQAINFSYKVAKKEKTQKPSWQVSSDSESSSEDERPVRTLPPPLPELSSSSESDIPEFVPKPIKQKPQPVPKAPKEPQGPLEINLKTVSLRSDRQRRERKTNKRRDDDGSDDDVDLNLDFGAAKTVKGGARAKRVDVSDITELQRIKLKDQQAASKNTLKDKISVDMGQIVQAGSEDTSKLSVEEKRRRQIKMRIKRTKDGKFIDLDTGEEIDPSMFKKQLGQ